jgi:mRNA-degrading endonuclease RelE of RelBE toxin-antitoxin system
MNYSVYTIPPFDKQLKRLSKKYPSLRNDFSEFLKSLKENPEQGTALGNNCFKIRLAITDKGKGKSGGARIITHVKVIQSSVYLLSVYDKSEKEDIPNKYIADLLKYIH